MDKGIEIAFNWIFSVIAGAIILTFMIYFAVQNTDLFGNLTANKVAFELDNVFSGFQTTLLETNLEFNKDIKLEFKCENNKEKILINDKGRGVLRDKIIFAPSISKNSKFYLFTKEWKVPYKVANFIFLTNSTEKYNLQGKPRDFEFPTSLESNEGKYIEFNKDTNKCIRQFGKIIINYQKENDEYYGWICIPNGEYGFYGEAMVYAAIFSDDFDCLYPLMTEKLKLVSDLYKEKTVIINDQYSKRKLGNYDINKLKDNPFDFNIYVNEIILNNERRTKQNADSLY